MNLVSFAGTIPAGGNLDVSFSMIPPNARPVLTCYTASSLTPPVGWLLVSDGFDLASTFCGLIQQPDGSWVAALRQGISGWFYYMVVIW